MRIGITGRYGCRTGVLNADELSLLPANETILARWSKRERQWDASYIIGKWHLGGFQPYPLIPTSS